MPQPVSGANGGGRTPLASSYVVGRRHRSLFSLGADAMLMMSRLPVCAAVAPLALVVWGIAASPSLVAADPIPWVPVVPSEFRYGPVPVPYHLGSYTTYPYTSGSIADISDSSLLTFAHVRGGDNILQSNGSRVDTGTFYLFEFQIDPKAQYFRIEFTAQASDSLSPAYNGFTIYGITPGGGLTYPLNTIAARQPTTFGIDFGRTYSSGNESIGSGIGSDSLMFPGEGRLGIVLAGGYTATLDQLGAVDTFLYELNGSYAVPEQPTLFLIVAGGLLTAGLARLRAVGASVGRQGLVPWTGRHREAGDE